MTVHVGDCRETMRALPPESVDAIVSDPPYGLSFMGKGWDHGVPGVEFWTDALRVAKPGSYLLAFGGTRTYHRLAVAIEDAGFELHDCLCWLYGSGFPKHRSKLKPAWEPIIVARRPAAKATPLSIDACRLATGEDTSRTNNGSALGMMNDDGWQPRAMTTGGDARGRWPANVALDEDAAAILDEQSGTTVSKASARGDLADHRGGAYASGSGKRIAGSDSVRGHSDAGGASRSVYCAKASRKEREAGLDGMPARLPTSLAGGGEGANDPVSQRFTKTARNVHPTVKPIALMRWLVRLVTPEGGLVLDPFTGSGTTGCAAVLEGRRFVGCELSEEYAAIARARIAHWTPTQAELGVA